MEGRQSQYGEYDFSDIPGSENWMKLSEVDSGNSSDKKFKIKINGDEHYLLRIADKTAYDRKKNEFEYLKTINALGASCPIPVDFGVCNHGNSIYLQTCWVYGKSGTERLLDLDICKQYMMGTEAAVCLRATHYCRPVINQKTSLERHQKRVSALVGSCHKNFKKIPCEQRIFDLIEACQPLLKNRPCRLLHGDFTIDNTIISREYSYNLVNFENWQCGDPLADLSNVLTSIRQFCLPYAIAILDCYFGFTISDTEFRLMQYYALIGLLENLVHARIEGDEAIQKAMEQIRLFAKDFHNFRTIEPIWYKKIYVSDKTVTL